MRKNVRGETQSTAEPRWGWSGVAPRTAVKLSASDIDLQVLLPGHRSSNDQILLALRGLGGTYHRYLHQDEFGPTRAERMAALRLLLYQFDLLVSRLKALPKHLRLRLSKQLYGNPILLGHDVDNFQAHRNDEAVVRKVGEAAVDVGRMLENASAAPDAQPMDDLSDAAERTLQLLRALDTTTAGALAIDTELPRLEVEEGAESEVFGFAVVCGRIERLRRHAELTLARLERQKGPERSVSARWLVWRLCDLYQCETGRPVTSSAVADYSYRGTPQSPAGRFVLAAVEALQPPDAWAQKPDHWVAQRRVHILNKGCLGRTVYFAMREYVARHPSAGRRRGRKRTE